MSKSTAKRAGGLAPLLEQLSKAARARALTDTAWAERAGLRKETLSRLRGRRSCDFATLVALAGVLGARLELQMRAQPAVSDDGLFPARFLREDERRLVELALSRDFGMQRWLSAGPRFFTSGFAVMLASLRGFDRPRLLALAEQLHPGGTQAEVFALWLTRAPFRPARFVSLLASPGRHAA